MTVSLISMAQRVLSLIDLTSLNDDDTAADIMALCQQAGSRFGTVAAVCVYPAFVALAKQSLQERGLAQVRVATVSNFPAGGDDIALAAAETSAAIAAGADEVDVVFPYRALLMGKGGLGADLLAACKLACQGKTLKVIIESGELADEKLIRQASVLAMDAGADFLKTSTGKVAVNATLPAARVMLEAIRDAGGHCGFKAAGGVRTLSQALAYIELAESLLGADWVSAQRFRFGASALLGSVQAVIAGQAADSAAQY
ncbi:deoxyribose-phosphate aldolase [Neisseriaceae bacterium TC5R-5]|nr:deoxyribose-phosphate aldolase [Neisseriaceae bacterium TC5R-5]